MDFSHSTLHSTIIARRFETTIFTECLVSVVGHSVLHGPLLEIVDLKVGADIHVTESCTELGSRAMHVVSSTRPTTIVPTNFYM